MAKFDFDDKKIRIHFINDNNNNKLIIDCQLYKHRLTERWWALMHHLAPQTKIQEDGFFFGQLLDDEDYLVKELNNIIETVNTFIKKNGYHELEIPLRATKDCPQDILNELHVYFEKYCHDPRLEPHLRGPLSLMNIFIHRLEVFDEGKKNNRAHIEILPDPTRYLVFENEDYDLFTTDWTWGGLYLTYGITGVPTIGAFYSKSEARPQHCMSQGMFLAFFGDSTFDRTQELHDWMRSRGMDPSDKRWAVGYLPLGLMVSPDMPTSEEDRIQLLLQLGKHRKIEKFELIGSKPSLSVEPLTTFPDDIIKPSKPLSLSNTNPTNSTSSSQSANQNLENAAWPYDQEIFYNLDYVPYIDLGIKFDATALLEEAKKALPYFVTHRDYDQESKTGHGEWKSLGLRSINGDWTKTQYHTSYGIETPDANYQQTPFAQLCPKTMEFLNTITDINQCDRIRYMLLEPGASIKTHRDSKDRDVSLAVNISLNMPRECRFYTDVNPDGTNNDYTQTVPFSDDGSVILFNNAKYHRVENLSDTPRIHIIIHGPIRFNDNYILNRARIQNQIYDRKQLLKKLILKKAFQGESFEKTPILQKDILAAGVDYDMLGKDVQIIAYRHQTDKNPQELEDAFDKITCGSLFPLSYKECFASEIDEKIKELHQNKMKFAVIVAAGTFISEMNMFIVEVLKQIKDIREKNALLAGHILDFKRDGAIPYLHEQFAIIDLDKLFQLNLSQVGPLFSTDQISFPSHNRGKDIHDDYTPSSLSQGTEVSARTGIAYWGSKVMAESLKQNFTVLNINKALRDTKFYSYPQDDLKEPKEVINKIIHSKIDQCKDEVFFFNNEPLRAVKVENFQPTKLISVSAGFKAFKIMDQYNFPSDGKVHYVDFSENALKYLKAITKKDAVFDLAQEIDQSMKSLVPWKWEQDLAKHLLNATIRDWFDNDETRFLNSLKIASKASFHHANFVLNHNDLCDLIEPNDSFYIWVSNAFYNNHLYFLLGTQGAKQKFYDLIIAISKKINKPAWHERYTRTIVFGEHFTKPCGVLTDGAAELCSKDEASWYDLTKVSVAQFQIEAN
jgi:hypothetical protein